MQPRLRSIRTLILTAMLLVALSATAFAATYEELNRADVFLKQESNGTCTLASTAMMLRRAALLNGEEDWASITEASCRSTFWINNRGLPYEFSYDEMTVSQGFLPGGEANVSFLADLLAEHPEGVVILATGVPHAVLLTEYTDGQFYCVDPARKVTDGVIPIEEAWGTRVTNSSQYWVVTSPVADIEDAESLQEAASPERLVGSMIAALSGESVQSASTLLSETLAGVL